MKHIAIVVIIILNSFTFCQEDNKEKLIIGSWTEFKTTTINGGNNDFFGIKLEPSLSLLFSEDDSKCIMSLNQQQMEANYLISDDELIIGNNKYLMNKLSHDSLIITNIDKYDLKEFTIRHYFVRNEK